MVVEYVQSGTGQSADAQGSASSGDEGIWGVDLTPHGSIEKTGRHGVAVLSPIYTKHLIVPCPALRTHVVQGAHLGTDELLLRMAHSNRRPGGWADWPLMMAYSSN